MCGLFCIAQQFTWETLVQVQCGASCQFSNLGTKASSEVASHYRTSVKNAGSILSMDLSFRNRLSVVTGKQSCGQRDKSPAEATALRCGGCFYDRPSFTPHPRYTLSCQLTPAALLPALRRAISRACTLAIYHLLYKQDGDCQHIVA